MVEEVLDVAAEVGFRRSPGWVFVLAALVAAQGWLTLHLFGPGGPTVACASGALAQKGREFVHGFEVYFEQATLVFESGARPLTVLPTGGGAEHPALGDGNPLTGFAAELQAAAVEAAHGSTAWLDRLNMTALAKDFARNRRRMPLGKEPPRVKS